jgi:Icc-related predicted phosphoesterase
MRLLVTSDLHGEYGPLREAVRLERPDFILNSGDLSTYENPGAPMYFIAGNHEDWDFIAAMDAGTKSIENLRHVRTGEIYSIEGDGGVVLIADINGNYGPSCFEKSRHGLKGGRRRHFVSEDIDACKALQGQGVDIFLTHECPVALNLINPRAKKNVGIPIIDEVVSAVNPRYAFSGHHHYYQRGNLGETQLVSVPRLPQYLMLDTSGSWSLELKSLSEEVVRG